MAEWMEVMNQFDRMCAYYQREHECPMGCPMNGLNISQCRKIAFECPDSVERTVMSWAAEHPEPVYPTWLEWLTEQGVIPDHHAALNSTEPGTRAARYFVTIKAFDRIPADMAEKLGIEPKEKRDGKD